MHSNVALYHGKKRDKEAYREEYQDHDHLKDIFNHQLQRLKDWSDDGNKDEDTVKEPHQSK